MKFRISKPASAPSAPSTSPAAPVAAPTVAPVALDPAPLRRALKSLDIVQVGIVEFLQTIEVWKQDVKRCEENFDPRNDDDMRQLRVCKDKVELAPMQLRKEDARVLDALDALLSATRAFDHQLLASAKAEYDALNSAIAAKVEPALAPILAEYRMNAAQVAASVAGGFAGLAHIPLLATAFQPDANPDYLISLEGPHYFSRPVVRGSQDAPLAADVQSLADFERILRERAAALLAVYARWEANGKSFVPADYDTAVPVYEVAALAVPMMPPTYRFAQPAAKVAADLAAAPVNLTTLTLQGQNLGGVARVPVGAQSVGPDSLGGYSRRASTPAQGNTSRPVPPVSDAPAEAGATPSVDLEALKL